MFTPKFIACGGALLLLFGLPAQAGAEPTYGFGTKATAKEIAGWDIDVTPDGKGLPGGSGSVAQGKRVYAENCAACHGVNGEGKPADRLVGGQGTLNSAAPIKTVGSYWPYATTLYDYINRAMPFNSPESLKPDEVYAVTAYLLYLNGIVAADAVMNAATLVKVEMPNRKNFVSDPRPDVANVPCLVNCK